MSMPLLRAGLPRATPGMVVGLLGGSFDPAHEGHVNLTLGALRRFRLDRVWWLVSPGNPLKTKGPAEISRRIAQAEKVMRHPKVCITDLESRLGTRYTADTLRQLRALYPGVTFVWLMGTDNLKTFHLWRDWREIAQTTALGVIARPGSQLSARFSPAARYLAAATLPESRHAALGKGQPPALAIARLPMSAASSTALRAAGHWR